MKTLKKQSKKQKIKIKILLKLQDQVKKYLKIQRKQIERFTSTMHFISAWP